MPYVKQWLIMKGRSLDITFAKDWLPPFTQSGINTTKIKVVSAGNLNISETCKMFSWKRLVIVTIYFVRQIYNWCLKKYTTPIKTKSGKSLLLSKYFYSDIWRQVLVIVDLLHFFYIVITVECRAAARQMINKFKSALRFPDL